MAKHRIKITDEILDFNTVEDFALIRSEYKQKQQVLAKIACAKRNNVKIWGQYQMYSILKYIKESYGPKYLQQFRRASKQQ